MREFWTKASELDISDFEAFIRDSGIHPLELAKIREYAEKILDQRVVETSWTGRKPRDLPDLPKIYNDICDLSVTDPDSYHVIRAWLNAVTEHMMAELQTYSYMPDNYARLEQITLQVWQYRLQSDPSTALTNDPSTDLTWYPDFLEAAESLNIRSPRKHANTAFFRVLKSALIITKPPKQTKKQSDWDSYNRLSPAQKIAKRIDDATDAKGLIRVGRSGPESRVHRIETDYLLLSRSAVADFVEQNHILPPPRTAPSFAGAIAVMVNCGDYDRARAYLPA